MFGGGRRVADSEFGELTRRRGWWRGELTMPGGVVVPLAVPGGRSGPDLDALAMVAEVSVGYEQIRPLVRDALADHRHDPSAADDAGLEVPDPLYVAVIDLDDRPVVELGYQVEWDEEHTLGARLRDGELVELCGSVVSP